MAKLHSILAILALVVAGTDSANGAKQDSTISAALRSIPESPAAPPQPVEQSTKCAYLRNDRSPILIHKTDCTHGHIAEIDPPRTITYLLTRGQNADLDNMFPIQVLRGALGSSLHQYHCTCYYME